MNIRFVFGLLLFFSFSAQAQTFRNGFEPADTISLWSNHEVIRDSKAYKGLYVSYIDGQNEYVNSFRIPIPDQYFKRNFSVSTGGYFRLKKLPCEAFIVITVESADNETLFWHAEQTGESITKANRWKPFHFQVKLPADLPSGSRLVAYIWNHKREVFDLDEMWIRLDEITIPSFVPEIDFIRPKGEAEVLLKNPFYTVLFNHQHNTLMLADMDGKPLSEAVALHTGLKKPGRSLTRQVWKKESVAVIGDSITRAMFSSENRFSTTRLVLTSGSQSARLTFELQTVVKRNLSLHRHSLLMGLTDPIKYVFRRNSLCDTSNFQDEYYLGSAGFTAGEGRRTVSMYHSSGLSSVQLRAENSLLVANAGYEADHPQLHYPLSQTKQDYFNDNSARNYQKGDTIRAVFELFIGQADRNIPRFMLLPHGFEAAVVWTEHADYTDLRTQRAVNFGHEDIHDASKATGGFVGYGIPVTKSVFYNNPDSVTNDAVSGGLFPGLHATIQTDTAYFQFLRQLNFYGHEICLHTPEQFTATPENMKEALSFMKQHFGSPTWIDHGYNNASRNNRENAVCDGFDAHSANFSSGLWDEFDVKYFWNPYYEEVRPFEDWSYSAHLIIPYPGFGDAFPYLDFSPVNGFEGKYFWSTTGTLEVPQERKWDYFFSDDYLNALIKHRSIWINHVYPAWATEGKGFWKFDEDGKVVAQPGFNDALNRLQQFNASGTILSATLGELMQYHLAVQQLEYTRLDEGVVKLKNNNPNEIIGLSMTTRAAEVFVNGTEPNQKRVDDELVFWFDLPAFGEAIIQFAP